MFKSLKITNVINNSEILFDKQESMFLLDEVDWDTPSISFAEYKVPHKIGTNLSSVSVGSRKPLITGHIVSDMIDVDILGKSWEEYFDLQEQQIFKNQGILNKLISPFQDVIIEVNGYYLNARPTRPPKYGITEQTNNQVFCYFTLEFECFEPMFYSQTKVVNLASNVGLFHLPKSFLLNNLVFGKVLFERIKEVENNGDCRTGCLLKITARGGAVENPKVYNANTNEYMKFNNVRLEDGDYILINTETGKEDVNLYKFNSDKVTSLIGNIMKGSTFFQIEQGALYYAYEVDEQYETFVEVKIEFTEKYFNLEGM